MNNKEIYDTLKPFGFDFAITTSQVKDTFFKDDIYIDCCFNGKFGIRDRSIQSQNQYIYEGVSPSSENELKDILITSLINSLGLLRG